MEDSGLASLMSCWMMTFACTVALCGQTKPPEDGTKTEPDTLMIKVLVCEQD